MRICFELHSIFSLQNFPRSGPRTPLSSSPSHHPTHHNLFFSSFCAISTIPKLTLTFSFRILFVSMSFIKVEWIRGRSLMPPRLNSKTLRDTYSILGFYIPFYFTNHSNLALHYSLVEIK